MIEQHHSGSGDNVRDKIFVTIKKLAPDAIVKPMEMVFESLRKKDQKTAKTLMSVLKCMGHQDTETHALLEAISIYGELLEPEEQGTAWSSVFRIATMSSDPIVKDVCLAAMIRLASNTDKAVEAKQHYADEPHHGVYSREAFLSYLADEPEIEAASQKFVLTEGEVTGIVEGALRLRLVDTAVRVGNRLVEMYPSYNAKVLLTIARARALNDELARRHLWLCTPQVKQKLDELTTDVVELMELSHGTDLRLYDMACPIADCYQWVVPSALLDKLRKFIDFLGPDHSRTVGQLKAIAGDDSQLPQWQRDLHAAQGSHLTRTAWCRSFLDANTHTSDQIIPFISLANPAEITEWLAGDLAVSDLSEKDTAFVRLLACAFKAAEQCNDLLQRRELVKQVDDFFTAWGHQINEIAPARIFELAEKLFSAKLPDKALSFTTLIIGDLELWPSNFVVTHLKCLLEAQQFKTFDEVLSRVKGADSSISLLDFRSLKEERMGNTQLALEISDQMIQLAPELPYCWYRGCFLRDRYQSLEEQRLFQGKIPNSLLLQHSRSAAAILFFLTRAGNFKRAESQWVDWFIKSPLDLSIEFCDFFFGSTIKNQTNFEMSASLPQCLAAVQFTQDGVRQTKLIVDDHLDISECTLKGSSHLGQLLLTSNVGEKLSLGMMTYVIEERLPPYVACLRMAAQLRHTHNDGSDCFVIMTAPSDPAELVPLLEEKLSKGSEGRSRLRTIDNIPLFMRGHGLFSENAFKAAFNCWTDAGIPKSVLFDKGEENPKEVILDAYSICYLAVTDLVQRLLDMGITFILPSTTKETLADWIRQISDENFMTMGLTEAGKFFRTTASDLKDREGHTLKALGLILESSSVQNPGLHDAALEVYSIKNGIDHTVYDAMQLSSASNIPWLCMDAVFAILHESAGRQVVNAQMLIAQAMNREPFNLDQKRHALLLYAIGALPLPLLYSDLKYLARHPNNLASFLLFKIIKNHGCQIFVENQRSQFLLDLVRNHLYTEFFLHESYTTHPPYTPVVSYSSYVFNHGIKLFLTSSEKGTAEYRLAVAIGYMCTPISHDAGFLKHLVKNFIYFADGHFMDKDAIREHFIFITSAPPDGTPEKSTHRK